jgi:nucleotide-binding universal stress UspA family protein
MFQKVLVPTDFSRYAAKMTQCIGSMPGVREVVLLHIVDASNPMSIEKTGWSYDSLIDEAKARLEDEKKHLEDEGLIVKTALKVIIEPLTGADGVDMKNLEPRSDVVHIDGGTIGDAIQKTADEEKVSLIVMGAQGKSLVEGILLGSVSADVLRHGRTNLIIVRYNILKDVGSDSFKNPFSNMFSNVLVPTDFSASAGEAISLVKGLQFPEKIALANVISKGKEIDEAGARLNSIRRELADKGADVTVHVLEGDPAKEIIDLAKKQDSTLIIMSSQGKGWMKQIRVGSTTFDVAHMAAIPVMVVKQNKP